MKEPPIKPILTSLACLGVAGISSMAAGPGSGLVMSALFSIINTVSGNVASDQLLKINPSGVRRWWSRRGPDISNHDLFHALQQSVVDALRVTLHQYEIQAGGQLERRQIKSIRRAVNELCAEVEKSFLSVFGENITDEAINEYAEGRGSRLYTQFAEYLQLDQLAEDGPEFLLFVQEVLPRNITAAFSEQLKTNQRAWVAYQRLILTELQDQIKGQSHLTVQMHESIGKIQEQVNAIHALYSTGNDAMAGVLMQQLVEFQAFQTQSQSSLQTLLEDLNEESEQFRKEWKSKFQSDELFQQYVIDRLETMHGILFNRILEQRASSLSEAQMDSETLPLYLEWIKKQCSKISLPAIREKTKLPKIPLEKVYVALQLTDEKTQQELRYGSILIRQKIQARENKEGRNLEEEERVRIRAEVLQQNRILRSLGGNESADGNIFDQPGTRSSINLAEAFQQHRYLVILGDPGSGKSTLSKWLSLHLAESLSKSEQQGQILPTLVPTMQVVHEELDQNKTIDLGPARLPVLIKVSEYAEFYEGFSNDHKGREAGRDIIDYIGHHLPSMPGLSAQAVNQLVRNYLEKGQCVVLLDGMDEIVKDRGKIIEAIERFIDFWIDGKNGATDAAPAITGGNQLVVTSRIVGYHAEPFNYPMTLVYVKPMDRKAIEHFCDVWTYQILLAERDKSLDEAAFVALAQTQANALKAAIFDDKRPRVRELATNPLLVTILALLYGYQKGQLPKTRVELYERSISILLEKWRSSSSDDLSTTELNLFLPLLAAHIHASPSEDITEPDLKDLLLEELLRQNGQKKTDLVPTEIHQKVERFLKKVQEDVGLLSERGEKLYHFLHRTFQEYLAGQYLIWDKAKAASQIIERMSDPVWREPTLLALGYANQHWPEAEFNALIRDLLKAEDELKDLVPRGVLLIAMALPEMERLSSDVFREIVVQFLSAFGDREGIGQFEPIRRQIKQIIDKIRQGTQSGEFFELCAALLAESVYQAPQWALLSLAADDLWYREEWISDLFRQQDHDSSEWNWPIETILRDVFANPSNPAKDCPHLRFRNLLLSEEEPVLQQFIASQPDWIRLLTVLYGGWPCERNVEDFLRFESYKFNLFERNTDMENEGYQQAVKLDTEGKKADPIFRGPATFQAGFIYRETVFTRVILRTLARQEPAEELIPVFLSAWESGETTEERALALLALTALGHNTAKLIYEAEQKLKYANVIERFLQHLNRIQGSLTYSCARYFAALRNHPQRLGKSSAGSLPKDFQAYTLRVFHDAFAEAVFPPWHTTALIPGQQAFLNDPAEMDVDILSEMEADAWISRLGTFTLDPVHQMAIYLDTASKQLTGENGQQLLEALWRVPQSRQRKNRYVLAWKMPGLLFYPKTELDKLLIALKVIDGLPPKYDFLREWFVVSLWPILKKHPEAIPYAITLLIDKEVYIQLISRLVPEVFGAENPKAVLGEMILATEHPYCRFLAIDQLSETDRSIRLQQSHFESVPMIEEPEYWLQAIDRVLYEHQIDVELEEGEKLSIAFIARQTWKQLFGIQSFTSQLKDRLEQIDSTENRIYAEFHFFRNQSREKVQEIVFQSLEAIIQMADDRPRARALRFVLDHQRAVATAFSGWARINASFQSPFYLNHALSKDYLNLIGFEQWIAPAPSVEEEQETIPEDARPNWALVSMFRMCQELRNRFAINDLIRYNLNLLLEEEKQEAALSFIMDHASNGIDLNRQVVGILDGLYERNLSNYIHVLLPLVDLRAANDLSLVTHWKNHAHREFSDFYCLLCAEAGHLDVPAVDAIITYLQHAPDRLRFRAAKAIHGTDPSSSNMYRDYRTSHLSKETLLHLYGRIKDMDDQPAITTTLGWFTHNLVHDDPRMIEELVICMEEFPKGLSKIARNIIRSMECASIQVIQTLVTQLTQAKGETAFAIWNALCRLSYAGAMSGRRRIGVQAGLLKAVKSPVALDSLKKYEIYHLDFDLVYEALLQSGDDTSTVDSMVQKAQTFLREASRIDVFGASERSEAAFLEAAVLAGSTNYVSISDENRLKQQFSEKISGKPHLIAALSKWTLQMLEQELIDDKRQFFPGSTLAFLLAQVAKDYPDTFEGVTDKERAIAILTDTVQFHPYFQARAGAITMLCLLRSITPTVLAAVVRAINDVEEVRNNALQEFEKFNRIANDDTYEQLKQLLFSSSGSVARVAAITAGSIAKKATFDLMLRQKTQRAIATALRRQITDPSSKQLIYNQQYSIFGSAPRFVGKMETILFEELLHLSGVEHN